MIALAAELRWRPREMARWRPWAGAASALLHGIAVLLVLVWLDPRRAPEPAEQEGVEMFWQQEEGEAVGEGAAQDLPGAPMEEEAQPPPAEASAEPTQPDAPAAPPVAEAPPPQQLAEEQPQPPPEPPAMAEQTPLPVPPPPPPQAAVPLPAPQAAAVQTPRPPSPPAPPRPQAQAAQPSQPARSKRSAQANEPAGLSTMSAPVRIIGATTEPSIDFQPPQPTYPESARRMNQTGATKVKLHIDTAGRVTQVEVLETSGHVALDRATQAYAEKFRFRPALRDGQPVPSFTVTTVHWRLSR